MSLTPIEVELLRNAFTSIADEMYVALMKSAYSTNIKERKDHSTAIIDAQGRVVVQGESLPLHLASMLGLVEVVLERVGKQNIRPGDMFISNDPFVGKGSHLPDVALVAPVFHNGDLVFFVADIAHHADIGGMSPGSMAGGMTEVYQEGLRIPPIRICRDGKIIDDVFDLILLNVRVPEERRGDYLAQVAANKLGERRLHELFERWPINQLKEGAGAIIASVARRMRAGIADLPDGEYSFKDMMDDDGMGTTDIPFAVRIVVKGDEILFDFEGSSPQVRGNINISYAGLQASVLFALKVLIDPDGPTNHGMLDPVTIIAEPGTITNAAFPAATAARAQACQRVIDVILGAMAEAVPERVTAASNGANGVMAFFGTRADGEYYVYIETIGGGGGGRSYKDGKDGVQVHVTNTSNLPVEALENEYPLMIERYELVPDSGGAGKWRGGLGLHRVYRPIGHTTVFSGQGERCVHHPWGLFGGGGGGLGSFFLLHDDGSRESLPIKPTTLELKPQSTVSVITPGAGGYGSPGERSHEDLVEDLTSGRFSAKTMKENYGFELGADAPAAFNERRKR
jgi:N-methylhydantoinase B